MDKLHSTRKALAPGGDDIQKSILLAIDPISRVKSAGFGQVLLIVNVRHGSICETIVEEKRTTTTR
jgi:hypothetical protein